MKELTLVVTLVRFADNTKDEQYRPLDAEESKKAYDNCANWPASFVHKSECVSNQLKEKYYL
jgi:hypothetical protein